MLRWLQRNSTVAALAVLLAPAVAGAAGFIYTPDECYVVQKVDKASNAVHLSVAGKCQRRVGRAFVDLDGEVTIYRDGREWKKQTVQPLSMPDLSKTLKDAERMAKYMSVPKNRFEKEMQAEAAKTIAVYHSPEYQAKIAAEMERIKREMFHEQLKDLPAEKGGLKQESEKAENIFAAPGRLQDDERIYVFISSSMPMETIRSYAAAIGRMNDPKKIVMVMRGFIGGMQKIGPTTSFIADLLKVKSSCDLAAGEQCQMVNANVLVDPILFRRYGITQVPATVYVKGVKVNIPEQSEGNDDVSVGSFWTVYGDAALEYNLDKIRQDSGSESLKRLLASRR
ncbi:type-F conjugative transfer system pilin assembly protein TrbC [Geobacter anodireducens]